MGTTNPEIEESISIDSFRRSLADFLGKRKWIEGLEPSTGRTTFQKSNVIHKAGDLPDFRTLSRRKKMVGREQLIDYTTNFFSERCKVVKPVPAINGKNTLFTVAGIQAIDPTLFNEEALPEELMFILQPSIRMNSIDSVDGQKGFSTSFVNATTLRVNSPVDEHFKVLDLWLEYLSSLGIFAGDVTLIIDRDEQDWGKGPFKNIRIDVFYGDLQLGDAVFIYDFPQTIRSNLTVSDIGFGLERIAWAINKHSSYFDWVGPVRLSLFREDKLIDSIRTMTLMAAHNVVPSNKAQGYRFRQLSKVAAKNSNFIDIETLVRFYHRFWKMFFDELIDPSECEANVRMEYNRNLVLKMDSSTPTVHDPDEILEEIFLKKGRDAAIKIIKSKF